MSDIERLQERYAEALLMLHTAVIVADHARDEWDRAPDGKRAGRPPASSVHVFSGRTIPLIRKVWP